MAVNLYFNNYTQNFNPEQNLVEDLIIESIKINGSDILYLPRKSIERDLVFGEDILTLFDANHEIEMYLDSVDGFEGEGDVLAQYGLSIKDTCTFSVSKKRFQEVLYDKEKPLAGDLIYFPLSNSIFEINYVHDENPFYQLGKLYVYKLDCEKFTYSHEEFNTGRKKLDDIQLNNGDSGLLDSEGDTTTETANVYQAEDGDNIEIRKESISSVVSFDEVNPFGEV